jgi:hypothetical protein
MNAMNFITRNTARYAAIALGVSLGCLVQLGAPASSAEGINLRPRYTVGDKYVLALATTSRTNILARGDVARTIDEEVELRYSARVEVVETAADGSPLRERHETVELTIVQGENSRSLFKKGADFDVLRTGDGAVQVFHDGQRVDPKLEKIVSHLLARQLEHGVGALVDPGREVEVGETWAIDNDRVQDFLRVRGLQDAELDGPATATLEERPGDRLVVRYSIPIAGFAMGELPSNARNARSRANLDGEVQLGAAGIHRPIGHSSSLAVRIKASTSEPGKTRAAVWSVRRSESLVQHSQTVTDQLASRS